MSSVLEVHQLVLGRGSRLPVLAIDTLSVSDGEVLAVIGPNGAGKTTLLLALGQLLVPESGQITFHGQPLRARDGLAYRRRIGLVLQDPLLLDASVFDNTAAGLRFRGLPRSEVTRRVDEWLARLGIAHLRDRPAHKLSGGEARRVSLARAFALQPDVLLLDEPFGGLDAPTRARLLAEFQDLLAATEMTTVLVTHDLNEARLLGDRVAVIVEGRLRQCGSPDQVFSTPADAEVAVFVGMETLIAGRVLAAQSGRATVAVGGLQVEAVGQVSPGRQVLLCLRPEDVTLRTDGGPSESLAGNRLTGRIVHRMPYGSLERVVVECGFPLVALVTRSSAREMGLAEGRAVAVEFSASAAHLIPC